MNCDKTHEDERKKCSGVQQQDRNTTPKLEKSKRILGHLKLSPYLESIADDNRMRKWIVDRIVERALEILKEDDDHE